MADVVLLDASSIPHTYEGVNKIKIPTSGGGEAEFVLPTGTKNITATGSVDVGGYKYAQVSDANLAAGNIKSGVSILGVAGDYGGEERPEYLLRDGDTISHLYFNQEYDLDSFLADLTYDQTIRVEGVTFSYCHLGVGFLEAVDLTALGLSGEYAIVWLDLENERILAVYSTTVLAGLGVTSAGWQMADYAPTNSFSVDYDSINEDFLDVLDFVVAQEPIAFGRVGSKPDYLINDGDTVEELYFNTADTIDIGGSSVTMDQFLAQLTYDQTETETGADLNYCYLGLDYLLAFDMTNLGMQGEYAMVWMENAPVILYATAAVPAFGVTVAGWQVARLTLDSPVTANYASMSDDLLPLMDYLIAKKAMAFGESVSGSANLLDNWYFVGGGSQQGGGQFPINQRGQTSYTVNAYAIDRWKIISAGDSMTINSDGITVASISSHNNWTIFGQYLPCEAFKGKRMTVSILADAVSGNGYNIIFRLQQGNTYVTQTGTPIYPGAPTSLTYTIPANTNADTLIIGLQHISSSSPVNSSIKIRAIKLEFGFLQTLAHQAGNVWVLNDPLPNYQRELEKCQRYQLPVRSQTEFTGIVNPENNKQVLFTIPTPVTMIKIPTLTGGLEDRTKWNVYVGASPIVPSGSLSVRGVSTNAVNMVAPVANSISTAQPIVVRFTQDTGMLDANI